MLDNVKEYDIKRKSVVNDKTVARMWAYTDYEEVLNLIVNVDYEDYYNNAEEIKEDIRYFIWLSFKDIVDKDIHIERIHSEIPEFIDIDISTSVGVNTSHHGEVPKEVCENVLGEINDVIEQNASDVIGYDGIESVESIFNEWSGLQGIDD
jgi:hypothetical protein